MTFELILFWGAIVVLAAFLLGGVVITTTTKGDEFAGHPKGLFVLFLAEMWERFSYYGMRALLIFYLVQHWLFSDAEASVIYGAYTALVYITPVVGGYLADRYLGQRKAVLFGAILLTLGHFFMAFEGDGGQGDPVINIFWMALALIIVGSGFLKANISVIVGQLYPRTDVRRDAGYTIFYMGINVGAATASIICGYLGQTYGWQYGFGLAGFGMLIGLIFFVLGKPLLKGKGEPKDPALLKQKVAGMPREWSIYGLGILMVALCWAAVQYQELVGTVLGVFGGGLVLYVIYIAVVKLPSQERDRIFAALFLILTSIIFWALFEQAGSSLNLFTDRHVDRQGVEASMFQSINAIYIVLLAPVFAAMWQLLGKRGAEPSTPLKFGLGIVQVGLGFLVLVWGANSVGVNVPTPVIFIFLIYLLHTTGELCLSPVGLSAMNRLAPSHMASLIMGTWFFASAMGNFAAGLIAAATGAEGVGETAGKATVLGVYSTVGWTAVGVGIAVMVISPLIKKLMHLDTLVDDTVGDDLLGQKEVGEPQAAGIHPATRNT
ncbi:MFS transporter [Altererythrobacter confluentis]|uniref:MFS transporter n=1 Tax=Allopontixanthobacter confluentis TaxID=1849021 RepID=A0A6L7GIG8_9SPHN|nr:peptide MFS transporter [Allopontixanthobacter confluentis]MXP15316.1 MFS transporter [Allopontixanthobacter confluentis]